MAKISLNLDSRSLKNGMAHVRMRINHKGTSAFVSTGVYVEPQYFNADSLYDPINRKAQMFAVKRDRIAALVRQVDDFIAETDRAELANLSANDIRERACVHTRKHTQEKKQYHGGMDADFLTWFDQYGNSRQTEKTKKSYEYAWNVLREYCESRRFNVLRFGDIDYSRLTDLAKWLRETGRGESTRHMIECYVRAAYKDAQKRRMVSRENDPYYDYSIKPVPRKKIQSLNIEQMHTLMTAKITTSGLAKARDIAMMSFYLCGANLLDIYEMGPAQDGAAVFVRHKVENKIQLPLYIHIEPELAKLMKVYGGKDALFRFKESYPTYDTFQRRVTRQLKGVSKLVGFDVNMAKIRRSWATIAGRLRVEELVIDFSMGHIVSTINAVHYEEYEWDRTAEANRQVIDYVKTGVAQ